MAGTMAAKSTKTCTARLMIYIAIRIYKYAYHVWYMYVSCKESVRHSHSSDTDKTPLILYGAFNPDHLQPIDSLSNLFMTTADTPPPAFIVPVCEEPVEILYADESCLMVNKPSGLLSVPGRHPANKDCVISRVQETYPDALIVHRLDMDTSGVMVIARGKDSHKHLSIQFQDRKTEKEYCATVAGLVGQDEGVIDLPLRCDWPNRPKQMVDFERGKPTLTYYEVLERMPERNATQLKLIPITGRSHQLRVHCTELGHPILGCRFYGTEESIAAAPRLNLHASYLKVRHPETGEVLIGQSIPPFI